MSKISKGDFRNSKYCEKSFHNVKTRKDEFVQNLLKKHPKVEDHYRLIRECYKYKAEFASKVYDNKCAYCGVSTEIDPLSSYQIDHIIAKSLTEDVNVNHINNLALSCAWCNSRKKNIDIRNAFFLNPDSPLFKNVFVRDRGFYIQISDEYKHNATVENFYKKIQYTNQKRRLDYLLMTISDLSCKVENDKLIVVFDKLRKWRNTILF